MKDELNSILASQTGQKLDKIVTDTERDFFMGAEEAREYGLIDKVLDKSFK
jgi:ATP-dependent Clp protease protease subunit